MPKPGARQPRLELHAAAAELGSCLGASMSLSLVITRCLKLRGLNLGKPKPASAAQ